jgi:hypothetical protein
MNVEFLLYVCKVVSCNFFGSLKSNCVEAHVSI